jgi:hypothetical protein
MLCPGSLKAKLMDFSNSWFLGGGRQSGFAWRLQHIPIFMMIHGWNEQVNI